MDGRKFTGTGSYSVTVGEKTKHIRILTTTQGGGYQSATAIPINAYELPYT